MIKRIIKWGAFTFLIIMIGVAVVGGPTKFMDMIGIKEDSFMGNIVNKADSTNNYIADHKEDIGGFVNDNIIAPVKQGIEDGTIKQKTQDYINKAEDYAKENDLSGKAKNWFQGVTDWFKNGMNWAAQNGSVIK